MYHKFIKKCIYILPKEKILFSKEFSTRVNTECCYVINTSIKFYLNELPFCKRPDLKKNSHGTFYNFIDIRITLSFIRHQEHKSSTMRYVSITLSWHFFGLRLQDKHILNASETNAILMQILASNIQLHKTIFPHFHNGRKQKNLQIPLRKNKKYKDTIKE